ncbi:MAG: hypothetical protein O2856_05770 [Planctomycetota bacterium]|nr:hypothetical protein [Planctomycetota bacterium]
MESASNLADDATSKRRTLAESFADLQKLQAETSAQFQLRLQPIEARLLETEQANHRFSLSVAELNAALAAQKDLQQEAVENYTSHLAQLTRELKSAHSALDAAQQISATRETELNNEREKRAEAEKAHAMRLSEANKAASAAEHQHADIRRKLESRLTEMDAAMRQKKTEHDRLTTEIQQERERHAETRRLQTHGESALISRIAELEAASDALQAQVAETRVSQEALTRRDDEQTAAFAREREALTRELNQALANTATTRKEMAAAQETLHAHRLTFDQWRLQQERASAELQKTLSLTQSELAKAHNAIEIELTAAREQLASASRSEIDLRGRLEQLEAKASDVIRQKDAAAKSIEARRTQAEAALRLNEAERERLSTALEKERQQQVQLRQAAAAKEAELSRLLTNHEAATQTQIGQREEARRLLEDERRKLKDGEVQHAHERKRLEDHLRTAQASATAGQEELGSLRETLKAFGTTQSGQQAALTERIKALESETTESRKLLTAARGELDSLCKHRVVLETDLQRARQAMENACKEKEARSQAETELAQERKLLEHANATREDLSKRIDSLERQAQEARVTQADAQAKLNSEQKRARQQMEQSEKAREALQEELNDAQRHANTLAKDTARKIEAAVAAVTRIAEMIDLEIRNVARATEHSEAEQTSLRELLKHQADLADAHRKRSQLYLQERDTVLQRAALLAKESDHARAAAGRVEAKLSPEIGRLSGELAQSEKRLDVEQKRLNRIIDALRSQVANYNEEADQSTVLLEAARQELEKQRVQHAELAKKMIPRDVHESDVAQLNTALSAAQQRAELARHEIRASSMPDDLALIAKLETRAAELSVELDLRDARLASARKSLNVLRETNAQLRESELALQAQQSQPASSVITSEPEWLLKLEDDQIFGPVTTRALQDWAAECRVGPDHLVSSDGNTWVFAKDVSALHMDWTVELVDGSPYGPFNVHALHQLIEDGVVNPGGLLTHVLTRAQFSVESLLNPEFAHMTDQNERLTAENSRLETALRDALARIQELERRLNPAGIPPKQIKLPPKMVSTRNRQ